MRPESSAGASRAELDVMIQQFVREDILYREAVAMGLDGDDPITRRRSGWGALGTVCNRRDRGVPTIDRVASFL